MRQKRSLRRVLNYAERPSSTKYGSLSESHCGQNSARAAAGTEQLAAAHEKQNFAALWAGRAHGASQSGWFRFFTPRLRPSTEGVHLQMRIINQPVSYAGEARLQPPRDKIR